MKFIRKKLWDKVEYFYCVLFKPLYRYYTFNKKNIHHKYIKYFIEKEYDSLYVIYYGNDRYSVMKKYNKHKWVEDKITWFISDKEYMLIQYSAIIIDQDDYRIPPNNLTTRSLICKELHNSLKKQIIKAKLRGNFKNVE
jgi:hypothetical protein